jgi:hypothetical protein
VFIFKITMSIIALMTAVVWGQATVLCDDLKTATNPIYQGADGWFFRTVDLEKAQDFEEFEQLAMEIERLSKALEEMNIHLVVSLLPSRGMIYGDLIDVSLRETARFDLEAARASYLTFIENLRSRRVLAMDLLTPALAFKQDGDFYLKLDGHWTSEGAKVSTFAIAEQLSELSSEYRELEKSQYKTELIESNPREGVIQKRIQEMCGVSLEDERINLYHTVVLSEILPKKPLE